MLAALTLPASASAVTCTRIGTPGNDVIAGTPGRDVICGLGGNDQLIGRGGHDLLRGGAGNDTLRGGAGHDSLRGGAGDDALRGGARNDALRGGAGGDSLVGGPGTNTLDGGAGVDTANYSASVAAVDVNLATGAATGQGTDTLSGVENATGSPQADTLAGDGGANVLSGGNGNDTLVGGPGDDTLAGGPGSDAVDYSASTAPVSIDLAAGTASGEGSDTLSGIENATGSPQADTVAGDGGANVLDGAGGNDTVSGNGGPDVLHGDQGNDQLSGGDGDDDLYGDPNDDHLDGGAGDDRLDAGTGLNSCVGGGGADALGAGCDTTPPVLTDLSIWPTVDSAGGSEQIAFNARLTDDMDGLSPSGVVVTVDYPGPQYSVAVSLSLQSGTIQNGVWSGAATLVPLSPRGTYTVDRIQVEDRAGNSRSYSTTDLSDAGLPTTFERRDALFGFNESPSVAGVSQGSLENLAKLAGAGARRFPLDWRLVEPQRGAWNESAWASYKRTYDAILVRGMIPVIDFGFAPAWAREPGAPRSCQDWSFCRYPPARSSDGDWARFSAEVARRFPKAVLEVWNEPNAVGFWRSGPDPERYAELEAIAYGAIKSVNPSQTVLAGGLAAGQAGDMPLRGFLNRAYDADPGLKGNMDAISFHPYPIGSDLGAGSQFAKSFADVRAAATAHGDAGRRLWVTETGISTGGANAVSQAEQADALVRLYQQISTMSDVDAIIIHRLLPAAPAGSLDGGYALLSSAQAPFPPTPAYCALVQLAGNGYPGC